MSRKRDRIKVINRAPGKRGKQEVRFFDSLAEAAAYFERNEDRLANVPMHEKIARKSRGQK